MLLAGIIPFVVIFIVFNDNFLSCNNICCTTHRQSIKPHQVHDIYLTKEQQLQGKVDWLVKDPEAWDTMCEWWMSEEFKAISVWNR
jgi:hypothetical protein